MQKKTSIILFLLLALIGNVTAYASIAVGDFQYSWLSETLREARVCGPAKGTELSGDIVIPSTVIRPSDGKEYTVVEIGPSDGNIRYDDTDALPFQNQTKITSVTIPETVRQIYDEAFTGCTGITKFIVKLANPAYKSVNGVLYEKNRENGKTADLVRFPPASELTTFTIPDVPITSPARFIHYGAFRDNSNLKTLIFSKRVRPSFGAFVGNKGIEEFSGTSSSLIFKDGLLLDEDEETLIAVPPAYVKKGKFVVPEYVKSIYMYGCASLQADYIDFSNVKEIGRMAFSGASLKEVTIPATVTTIANGLFENCRYLKTATIETKIKVLEYGMFRNCERLSSVKLPSSCKGLRSECFKGCKALEAFSLANYTSMTDEPYVNSEHFAKSGIKKVNWPSQIATVPDMCFYRCEDLTSITLNAKTETIESCAFLGTKLETFNSTNLREIENYAFEDVTTLRKIVLAESDHTLSLGLGCFRVNDNAEIFIDHKDLGYIGWAEGDWTDAFYGTYNGIVYTSVIEPDIILDRWKKLYCPWGAKSQYDKFSWGTVEEMFTVNIDKNKKTVKPNFNWVKITEVNDSESGLDLHYTAKDVNMHTFYPSEFLNNVQTGIFAPEISENVLTIIEGNVLKINMPQPMRVCLFDLNGKIISDIENILEAEITLPSKGIYILTTGEGNSVLSRKIIY